MTDEELVRLNRMTANIRKRTIVYEQLRGERNAEPWAFCWEAR